MSGPQFVLWGVRVAELYLGVGLLFALAFAARGASRLDPSARGASLGFRVVLVPGATALWPLLAQRWRRGEGPRLEETPHKLAARERHA